MNEKKKILIISMAYFPRFVGGAEIAIKEITDRLGESFEFHLITLRYDSALPRVSQEGKVMVHRIGFTLKHPTLSDLRRLPLRFLKPWFQFGAFFAARKLHREHHFDAVWGMMAHTAGIPAALMKMQYPNLKYLLTLQEGDPPQQIERQMRLFGGLFKKAFTKADAIQAISTFLASWGRDRGGRDVVVIPNGADIMRFGSGHPLKHILEQATGKKILVTASRLVRKNGVDTVIAALPLPQLQDVFFVVAGDGPDRNMLEKQATALGVRDRVLFLGEVQHEELPNIFASADVFVRASRSEGQGIAFIEAMAAGLPVVGTDVGGIPDFLRPGETGYFAPADEHMEKSVAGAITLALNDQAQAVAMQGQKLVQTEYDWNSIATRMLELFESLWKK